MNDIKCAECGCIFTYNPQNSVKGFNIRVMLDGYSKAQILVDNEAIEQDCYRPNSEFTVEAVGPTGIIVKCHPSPSVTAFSSYSQNFCSYDCCRKHSVTWIESLLEKFKKGMEKENECRDS